MKIAETITIVQTTPKGLSWDNVKNRVYARLLPVDYEKDAIELVTEVSSVIRVGYFMDFPEITEVPVTTEMFSDWEISEADLYLQAVANLPEASLDKYSDYMIKITTEEQRAEMGIDELALSMFAPPLLIFGNAEFSTFGTAQILKQQNLDDIYEYVKGDFYMIPSSIHEWLIAPCDKFSNMTPEDLLGMNFAVNDNLREEDLFGNFILKYNGKEAVRVA